MKTLIAASLLLALAFPAHATEDPGGPRPRRSLIEQGMRDWREGQCFRARPYLDNSPEQEAWIRGYHAGAKKYPKRDMAHCHPGSIKGLN